MLIDTESFFCLLTILYIIAQNISSSFFWTTKLQKNNDIAQCFVILAPPLIPNFKKNNKILINLKPLKIIKL